MESELNQKKCYQCGIIKTTDFFHLKKDNRDGLMNTCKECSRQKYYSKPKPRDPDEIEDFFNWNGDAIYC